MNKCLIFILFFLSLISAQQGFSQTFGVASDTEYVTASSSGAFASDSVYSLSSSNLVSIQWKVTASNIPADWLGCLGICDNHQCYSNSALTTPPDQTWNGDSAYITHTSSPYPTSSSGGTFELSMPCTGTTSGCFYITVTLSDAANSSNSKKITFIVCKWPTNVNNFVKTGDDVHVFPNPAHNELDVTYSATQGVKTIAIYNIIGKQVSIFKPSDNSSAKLEVDNIPPGIYFLRLMGANDEIIATCKFIRQ